jgi:flagellar FliL protein
MAKNTSARKGAGRTASGGIFGVVIVTLLAIGGGGGFGFYLSGSLKPEPAEKPAPPRVAESKPTLPSDTKVIPLASIVTNLAEPKNAWIRIEASLVTEGQIEGESSLSGKVAEDVVAFLKTVPLAEVEGAGGFEHLREDLNDRVRVRGGSKVRELVIHGVIIE